MGALAGSLPSMRQMYRAAPGKRFVHADASQGELRVMAAVAPDDVLAANLASGDVYAADAKDWFHLEEGLDLIKLLKPAARKASKIIHLASNYGAGTNKVYLQALKQDPSISYDLVRRLHQGFKRTYCATVRYWEEEMKRVAACGYSETRILFTRRVYPRIPAMPEVVNYPIQGTLANLMNCAMVAIDDALRTTASIKFPDRSLIEAGNDFVTQLHDAFDIEAWREDVPSVTRIMRQHMEKTYVLPNGRTLTVPVEIKVDRWWDRV